MKICKLKLQNLNSFRGEQEIDFESGLLSDASLVAITGPTGAGKTTLLDAICVALYGKTPRLSGQGSQNPKHLISHGEKEGFAEVHFIANDTRYLATWSATQRGAPKGELRYADTDKLITDKLAKKGKSLGSSQNTVSEEVAVILGLDFDAFKRSVMLAQGEFAAFLKAKDEDRRTILEATAGIGIYDELKKALNDKVSAVETTTAEVLDKLNKIPEASQAQLTEAETALDSLQTEAEAFGTQSQHIQDEKQREEGRTADFERLQSSKDRQNELTVQQPEIDTLQTTLENAKRAQRLLPEKQAYDTAKSDLEDAEKARHTATTEKTEAAAQVKTDQTAYDEKREAYRTISDEHTQKIPLYADAKLEVGQAKNQFDQAEKREPTLANLSEQIDTLEDQLSDRQTQQTELQEQIDDAQRFLEENPLPSNRQQRLTQATGLLAKLTSNEKQLEAEMTNKASVGKKASSLKKEIEKLSKTQEECLSEKASAETKLEDAKTHLNKLLATATREKWTDWKQQAAQTHTVVQKYEQMIEDLENISQQVDDLNNTLSTLDTELLQIEERFQEQTKVYWHAAEEVEHADEVLRSAVLTNPINQLRQRLHTGEPCSVCGATEHPLAGVVEPESEERVQEAENALENAKIAAQAAQDQMQDLRTKGIQLQQRKESIISQMEEEWKKIGVIEDEARSLSIEWNLDPDKLESLAVERGVSRDELDVLSMKWEMVYPDMDISSDWIDEQMEKADLAIAAIGAAEQARTKASHAYEMVSQQLEISENDLARETDSLNAVRNEGIDLSDTIEGLKEDIASTESNFWELLPKMFHGVAPKQTLQRFEEKIEEVATCQTGLNRAESDLKLLNANIEADQNRLETLRNNREDLQEEIDGYRREGETYLNAIRDKTGGLETEDEINTAMDKLAAELKAKEKARDDAEQQFQNSQNLLTEKQTTHGHCEKQYEESSKKLETARDIYFQRLDEAGFDSSEAHDNAFRNDDQIQDLTNQINTHEDEKRGLELVITELRTRFEETPFDPEALGRIEVQVEEIGEHLQAAQQEVGAQQQKICDLKDALEKREALAVGISEAEQELNRWKRLQDTIPRNDLRDFALEIMFRQMGSLANDQLRYLTSERYQLKVEGIGDLTVIDRWNANEERPVETLSGGESFLTSLALALALADLSRGRAQLNSLFLDEGFGTLDTETLDIAIAALEGLRMQGRSIFLISHIQELTRRLPVKINVSKRGNGSSSVDIRG